jgi:hypothetical protein
MRQAKLERVFQSKRRKKMANLITKSIYRSSFAKTALLGLMALCGAAGPAFGQANVSGKFTLTESTQLGKVSLPAGSYTFSIEPTGVTQSLSSIHGARQVVTVVVRPETKAGPTANIFAMATRSASALDSSKIVLGPAGTGVAMHTMYLNEQGLVLDLDWSSPKDKTQVIAQAARPEPVIISKASN